MRRLYNRFRRLSYLAFIEPFLYTAKRQVVKRIRDLGIKEVIEVGCGTCRQAAALAAAGIAVSAVDLSDKLFPSRKSTRMPQNLTFFQADGRSLPFADESYDVALTSMVLHEMEPVSRIPVLREMIRVLKNRGTVMIMDFDFDPKNDWNWSSLVIRIIERMAGRKHHGHFRDFVGSGGVPQLLKRLNLFKWHRQPILNGRGGLFEVRIDKR
jgi:ubiquinone/menaquinone biosynthesis C-methylase UbiE